MAWTNSEDSSGLDSFGIMLHHGPKKGDGDERLSRAKRGISAGGVAVRRGTGKIGPTLFYENIKLYHILSTIIHLDVYEIYIVTIRYKCYFMVGICL